MPYTLAQIAEALDARCEGDGTLPITGAAEPRDAGPESLALAMEPRYADGLPEGSARAAILWEGAQWRDMGLEGALFVRRPRYAMAGLTRALDPGPAIAAGRHGTAVVDPTARIGTGAAIGPFVVIEAGARIGAGARIAPHVWIGSDAVIGDGALLYAGVRIGPRVRIGANFIAHPGAVVGADGFAFVTPDRSAIEAVRESLGKETLTGETSYTRIHSLGSVEIGDDVEVGANATIDRGTIRATTVGSGTKIDNLVQIGHNCRVGRDTLICALVGVAGSVTIGDRVVLAGQVGISDNIQIGDDVVAGGASKIATSVPRGRVVMGYPAVKMTQHIEIYKALRRLPRLFTEVRALQKAVSKAPQSD